MANLTRFLPILWITVPVLYLAKTTHEALDLTSIIIITFGLIVLYIIGDLLLNRLFVNKNKLAIYWSVGIIWMFSYQASRYAFYKITESYLYENKYFIFIWIIVLVLGLALVRKIKNGSVIMIRNNLAATAIVMIGISLIGIGMVIVNNNQKINVNEVFDRGDGVITYDNKSLPNIYYIVLDEYPGSKELISYFNYDNREFEKMLKSRGFYIVNNSYCNYCFTFSSSAATLNMEYLSGDEDLTYKLINSKVKKYFNNIGYNFVMLQKVRSDAILYDDSPFNNTLFNLINMTFLAKPLGENCLRGDSQRKMILKQFEALENLVNPVEPTFVYAHIMIPHRPYLFDQNGVHLSYVARFFQHPGNAKHFMNQLTFANKIIKNMLDKIINKSKIQPIIILQGDHGPRPFYHDNKEQLKLRMSILNAYLLPQEVRQSLYDSITPVNSFRLILNKCFGENLYLLKDESYFARSELNEFVNVTKEIRSSSIK
jgi:hypothetical protein